MFALALFFWNADGVYRSGQFVPRTEQPTFFYSVVIHFVLFGFVALGLLLWTVFVPTEVMAPRPQGPRRRSLAWRIGAGTVGLASLGLLAVSFFWSEVGEIRLHADLMVSESAQPFLFHATLIIARFLCCIVLFAVVVAWPTAAEDQRPEGKTAKRRRLVFELGMAFGLLAIVLVGGWAIGGYALGAGEFTGSTGWIYSAAEDPALFYLKLGTAAFISLSLVVRVFYRIYVRYMNGEYRAED
ncbi:MAG: hypothetical protein AAGM22_14750 [Acidobacteriota bacterium]